MYDNLKTWYKAIDMGLLKKKDTNVPFSKKWADMLVQKIKSEEQAIDDIFFKWKQAYDQAQNSDGTIKSDTVQNTNQPPTPPAAKQEPKISNNNDVIVLGLSHKVQQDFLITKVSLSDSRYSTSIATWETGNNLDLKIAHNIEECILKLDSFVGKKFDSCLKQVHRNQGKKPLDDGKKAHIAMRLEEIFGSPIIAQNWRKEEFQKEFNVDSITKLTLSQWDRVNEMMDNISAKEIEVWKRAHKQDLELATPKEKKETKTEEPKKKVNEDDSPGADIDESEIPF